RAAPSLRSTRSSLAIPDITMRHETDSANAATDSDLRRSLAATWAGGCEWRGTARRSPSGESTELGKRALASFAPFRHRLRSPIRLFFPAGEDIQAQC